MSVHCEKCGLANYLPGLVKSLSKETEKLTEQNELLKQSCESAEANQILLDRVCEQVEEFRAALEYYASKDNWRRTTTMECGMTYNQAISSRDSSDVGPEKYTFSGGKIAREVLAKWPKPTGGVE